MKFILVLFTALLIFSCSGSQKESNEFTVEYKGALKNFMHKNDLSAKADLRDFKDTEHFYALGALENLKGEILVMDSKPFIAYGNGNKVETSHTMEHKAGLLVYTTVTEWESYEIPDTVVSYENLEEYIASIAAANEIDITKPFPFLIEGQANSIDWHVINWKDGDTEHSHKKHKESGPHGTLNKPTVEILGFYSDSHHAIFTHHTTNMHLHFKTSDGQLSGHVDGLVLGSGMRLKLPGV